VVESIGEVCQCDGGSKDHQLFFIEKLFDSVYGRLANITSLCQFKRVLQDCLLILGKQTGLSEVENLIKLILAYASCNAALLWKCEQYPHSLIRDESTYASSRSFPGKLS